MATGSNTLVVDQAINEWLVGDLYLGEIKRPLMECVFSDKLATNVRHATVNRMIEVIKAILNKCVKEREWLDRSPHIRMLKEAKSLNRRDLCR